MNIFSLFTGSRNSYDAVKSTKRRQSKPTNLRSEDNLLAPVDRDKLVSTARSLNRNHEGAAYAIRKHLDYVSTYNFQCRSADSDFNREVERLMRWWMRAYNCDASLRYDFSELTRMCERHATIDGDVFVYKIADDTNLDAPDYRVQIIEGDRVRTPSVVPDAFKSRLSDDELKKYKHGIKADEYGNHEKYLVCERTDAGGFELIEIVDATNVFFHGYCDRYDQLRGISPLSSALNTFFDINEAKEYALAKMKVSQLFALKIKSTEIADGSGDDSTDTTYDFNDGPQTMQLRDDEEADFLESSQPSDQFQSFMNKAISLALKSLDIPYSFFDESFTNYSGSRQALLLYEQSCDIKRKRLQKLLNNITVWRLKQFIADGHLTLPVGMYLTDLNFEWIPIGLPWIDPVKEVSANILAVKSGFTSRQRVCKDNGVDFFTIVEELKLENEALVNAGLSTDIENITLNIGETTNNGNADK